MTAKIRRNTPCPCGSGKKYKACCMRKSQSHQGITKQSSRFRMESGSYGDIGCFMPSIACYKETAPQEWHYHFVLVKLAEQHAEEGNASEEAEADLQKAFMRKEQTGSDFTVAEYLKAHGYISVTGFEIADSKNEIGWRKMD